MSNNWGKVAKFCFVLITFLLAYMLVILPLPVWAIWFRPQWVILVFIFWAMIMPANFGIVTAWFIGILLDLLYSCPLGENALFLVLVAYVISKFHPRIYFFSFWEMLLSIFITVVLYQVLEFTIRGFSHGYLEFFMCFSRAFISAVVWPWIAFVLKGYQEKFGIKGY
jgi:rod shape-determining protein MreD